MNILIINLHSAMNLGDEAIMHGTLAGIHRAYPGAQITLMANDPGSWDKFSNLEVASSFDHWIFDNRSSIKPPYAKFAITWFQLAWAQKIYAITRKPVTFGNPEQRRTLRAFYSADLILSCGGGNFFSNKKFGIFIPIISQLMALNFAVGLDKPVIMLPQSIGPLPGWFMKTICANTFNRTLRIMVRDKPSLELLRQIGVKRPVVLLPDLAFAMPGKSATPAPSPDQPTTTPKVGITLIDYQRLNRSFTNQSTYEAAIQAAAVHLQQADGARIYLFAQCYGPTIKQDDREITRRFYDRLREMKLNVCLMDTFNNTQEIQAEYRKMDLVIGTRMHSAILALSSGVPVVLVGYQPKAEGLMDSFGLRDYCCPINEVQIDTFCSLVSRAMSNRRALRQQVSNHLTTIHQQLDGWEKNLVY
jgi:colanic acid/amylovoran biosynthesis protein